MTSSKTTTPPQITIQHSSRSEAVYLIYLARVIQIHKFQSRGFLILPTLPQPRLQNIVVFPDLDYTSIPNFWPKVSKLKPWTPIKAPESLIKATSQLLTPLYQSKLYQSPVNQLHSQLNQHLTPFWTKFTQFFPQYTNRLTKVNIYPTQLGAISTFRLAKQENSTTDIYLRLDATIVDFFEAILTIILRPHLEQLHFSWEEIESIVDFLLLDSTLALKDVPYYGTIPHLRQQQFGRYQKQSQTYLTKLGITTHSFWQIKNQQIYFQDKPLENLSLNEQKLLEVLILKRPKIATFDEIIEHVWPQNYEITQWAVTKLVQRLRRKLHQNHIHLPLIQAHRKHGYSLT